MAADSAPSLRHPATPRPPRAACLPPTPPQPHPQPPPRPHAGSRTLTMLGEDIEAGLCGAPRQVPPAAGGPGCTAAPDPARLRLLKPRSLPDAAHLLPHPCARVLPRPRRPQVTFLLGSGLRLPALLRPLLPRPGPGPERSGRRRLRTRTPHSSRCAASGRLTDSPPSSSRGSAPPTPPSPPPPSLNHRALGERGTERLPPPARPVTSATRREGFPAAPPRPPRPRLLKGWVPPEPTSLARPQLLRVFWWASAPPGPPRSESALAIPPTFGSACYLLWRMDGLKPSLSHLHLSNQSVAVSAPGAWLFRRHSWDRNARGFCCLPSR